MAAYCALVLARFTACESMALFERKETAFTQRGMDDLTSPHLLNEELEPLFEPENSNLRYECGKLPITHEWLKQRKTIADVGRRLRSFFSSF